jgi:hypothetical protein
MVWLPVARFAWIVALPLPRLALPNVAPLSRNVTVPVAVAGVTEALSATGCPDGTGLGIAVNEVVESLLPFTVSVTAAEVLAPNLLSPL